jgi:hypothetical protein
MLEYNRRDTKRISKQGSINKRERDYDDTDWTTRHLQCSIGRSAEKILRKLQAASFVRQHQGEVCPASWKPGKKTLRPGLDLVGKI